ncbi:Uncharacterised protein [Vibrio owensii]|uniref:hypothetical protein n=1 Tax=Vibrio owensii TaxID=696485 RepID=UPI000577598D|nr:hypothetical protein [Vibrio owensii]SUP41117.1 Uncharacterised protein [Vibrio owensii]
MKIKTNLIVAALTISTHCAAESALMKDGYFAYEKDVVEVLEWYEANNHEYQVQGIFRNSQLTSDIWARVFTIDDNYARIGFYYFTNACEGYRRTQYQIDSARINGVLVKMNSQCISNGAALATPVTRKGNEYIKGQFQKSWTVKADILREYVVFSAASYLLAEKTVIENASGI